ncbi:hypothetical protein COOONC_09423 [Cooperia oncophora]
MVRQTRAAAKSDPDPASDVVVADVPCKGPPPSDATYQRKFVIAREGSLPNSRLYHVRHPKNGTPCLYRINEKHCDETVFKELDEIVSDPECPSIAVLLKNEAVYRIDEGKALEWIAGRFRRLRDALVGEGSLHKSITSNNEVLDRYSFGLLSDYMNPEMTALTKGYLAIRDPENIENERVDMSMKRKAEESYEDIAPKPAKKPKESVVMKKLQLASKGTKSINSFFTKKV